MPVPLRRQVGILLCLGVLLPLLSSCIRKATPQEAFDRAMRAFQNGDLLRAQTESENGYNSFRSSGADWAWKFTILRGRISYRRGLYRDALNLLISEPSAVPDGDLKVRKLWLLGLVHSSLHDFPSAEQELAEAGRLCTVSHYLACDNVPSAQGELEMERGHYARAQGFFERDLGLARQFSSQRWEASALLDLSWSAEEQTHFDEALDWAGRARDLAASLGAADVAQTASGNIGWAYYKLGDSERAEELFVEAEREAEELGNLSDQARWFQTLGYVYLDAGRTESAYASFERSLTLARQIHSREHIINSLIALAFVSEQTGKLDDATRYADEALSMAQADGNKRDATYPRLVQGRIAARQHDSVAAEAAFHEVEQSSDSPVFLKWEAQRSLAQLYETKNQTQRAAREYVTALSTFESARSELQHENSRLPFLKNATRIYGDYIHLLVTHGKVDEALEVADYSRARTLSEGLGLLNKTSTFQPDPVNASQIARRAGGTVFFYWLGEKESYLWVITPEKIRLFPLPLASQIEAAVHRYRRSLLGPVDPLETSNTDGLALYRMLVAPAGGLIPQAGRVFIIPDGSLNTLNFETLLVPDPKTHYWLEDVTITDASSLRLLAGTNSEQKRNRSLLLLGDAVTENARYPQLRNAGAEMEGIEKHFSPQREQIFTRAQATPAAYLSSRPAQFAYIHFVAHGTASRMSPLDSAIVLSGTGAENDSFKLYARDIIRRPLRAELVTISTCYGAGARAYSGEGLVGLSWAFLRAGAHNVIGALWEASDISTPRLMDNLYGELAKGRSPDVALRDAKLLLVHAGGGFRRPFYWAPFQLYTGS